MATTNPSTLRIKRADLNGDLCNAVRDKLLHQMLSLPGVHDPKHGASDSETPRNMILPADFVFLYAETGPESALVPMGSISLIRIHSMEAHFTGSLAELDSVGEVKRTIVFVEYQRLGIGRLLVESLERVAKEELGLRYLVVETMDVLEGAKGLYERCGFERRSVWGLYGEGEGSVCFGKWI